MQVPTYHAINSHPGAWTRGLPARTTTGQVASPSATSSSDSSSSASTSDATVTANDFLELLVTEMKNQDPTANTDPNQYINQLVQVNSLEQLIQINQDLTGASTTSGSQGSGQVSKGNLSTNVSDHSNLSRAASQVSRALEPKPNPLVQSTPSQSASKIPSPLSAVFQSAGKP